MSHKYTMFITLTYSNDFVPLMKPYHIDEPLDRLKHKRLYYFVNVTPRLGAPCEEIISESVMSVTALDILLKKCNTGDAIPYLSIRDAQLFMKRLRKNLSKYTDEKIRYYLVGEYGPQHFRPHYHLELWFSEEATRQALDCAIHQSWKFGRVDIQESTGQSANYVAGYLNGSCNLPRVFKQGKCKAFALHSQFLGEAILRGQKEEVYKMPVKDFISRRLHVNGTPTEFSMWRSFTSAYFPKCTSFASLSHNERLQSYRINAAASEVCRQTTPYKRAIEIVDEIISDTNSSVVHSYFAKKYNIHPYLGRTDYQRMIRRVYMDLRTSDHFLNFVCDGIDNLTHHHTMLYMIEAFYDQCERLNLAQQIQDENEFLKYDAYDIDDLCYFYYNKPFNLESFTSMPIYKKFREAEINKARNSVKHKWLNDKNKYFDNL